LRQALLLPERTNTLAKRLLKRRFHP
jgi:hypothetical protein